MDFQYGAPLAERVWSQAQPTWRAQLLGPHFEELVRRWCMTGLEWDGTPEPLIVVRPAVVNDRAGGVQAELDLVALTAGRGVVAVGEAKLDRLDLGHLERLERLRGLAAAQNPRFSFDDCRLVLASATGFDRALRARVVHRSDVVLVTAADVFAAPS